MSVDYAPEALAGRLRAMSARSDLRAERRLDCKVSYAPEALTERLRQQAMLRRACLEFARLGRAAALSGTSAGPAAS